MKLYNKAKNTHGNKYILSSDIFKLDFRANDLEYWAIYQKRPNRSGPMTIRWIAADPEWMISRDLRIAVMHAIFVSRTQIIITQHIKVAKKEVIKCQ